MATHDNSIDGRGSWLERWSPVAGPLFVAGTIVLFLSPAGDVPEEAEALVAHVEAHKAWVDYGGAFGLATLLLLGSFVAGLYARLRRHGEAESAFALVGGIVFTILFSLALLLWHGPLFELAGESSAVQRALADAYRATSDVGFAAFAGSGVGAGIMIVGASLAARRAGWLPVWATALSVALGVVGAATTMAIIGFFAWLGWIVIASLVLLLRDRRPREEPAHAGFVAGARS